MTQFLKAIIALVLCVFLCVAVFFLYKSWPWSWTERFKAAPAPIEVAPKLPEVDTIAVAYDNALALFAQGKTIEARQVCMEILAKAPNSKQADDLLIRLGALNSTDLFSPESTAFKKPYRVVSGDSVSRIAAKNGISMEALAFVNNLSSPNIRIGQTLQVPSIAGTAIINKEKKIITLQNNGEFFRTYPIVEIVGEIVNKNTPVRVADRYTLADGQRIAFDNKAFAESPRNIMLMPGAILLRTALALGEAPTQAKQGTRPPSVTIYIAPVDMKEIFLLLSTTSTVTIK